MSWLLLALLQAGPDVKLAEIEVVRGEKPKVNTRLGKDEDDGTFVARLSWAGGNDPGVPRPATSFGAMTRQQARDWAVGFVRGSLEGEWDDLSLPDAEPDGVEEGGKRIPTGWTLRLLQRHKGLAFEDNAGVLALLSDDLSFQEKGAATASVVVVRWTVVKEHGAAKAPFPRDKVVAAFKADFAKKRPDAKNVDVEASLVWAAKPGAADRRVPVWTATLEAPPKGKDLKPTERRYRADGWTGAILLAEDVARPGP